MEEAQKHRNKNVNTDSIQLMQKVRKTAALTLRDGHCSPSQPVQARFAAWGSWFDRRLWGESRHPPRCWPLHFHYVEVTGHLPQRLTAGRASLGCMGLGHHGVVLGLRMSKDNKDGGSGTRFFFGLCTQCSWWVSNLVFYAQSTIMVCSWWAHGDS